MHAVTYMLLNACALTMRQTLLRFATDGSVQNRGFRLNYTTTSAVCGGILKEEVGIIRFPTEREDYPRDLLCRSDTHCRDLISVEIIRSCHV